MISEVILHSDVNPQKVNECGYNWVLCLIALDYLMMKIMYRISVNFLWILTQFFISHWLFSVSNLEPKPQLEYAKSCGVF